MSELVEYFARHYTLVLDNDQGSYHAVRDAVREAMREETPDLTVSGYRAMADDERRSTYAYTIGASVLGLIEEWTDEIMDQSDDGIGALLIREVLITNGSDLADELGRHYLPEDNDIDNFLDADDTEEEDA